MSIAQDVASMTEVQQSFERAEFKPPEWSLWERICFRFAFCYLVVYSFIALENLGYPGTEPLLKPYDWIAQAIVPWVGKHILHLSEEIPKTMRGGGDQPSSYVSLFCFFVLSIVVTLAWSLLDHKRKQYDRLYDWLRVYIRYIAGFTMIEYGLAKVIQLQFPFPSPGQLAQPFGQQSPAALLWNFMGYSRPYSFFGGLAEVVGGALLFFRRTTTLGALISAGVMVNVVMLNFCYNVNVKLIASNLLLMLFFLMIPDIVRLTNVLVLNKPAMPVDEGALFHGKWTRIAGFTAKTLLIGFALIMFTKGTLDSQKQYGNIGPKPALYGIYDVEEFTQNGQVMPLLSTDPARWRKVIFDFSTMDIELMDDSTKYYGTAIDPAKSNVTLSARRDDSKKGVLTYSSPDADHVVLQGTLENNPVTIRLKRFDESKFALLSRKFRWFH